MSVNVTPWLTEIKALQKQLLDATQERAQAYDSATNWRTLYEREASQRRSEVQQLQQTIARLQQEIQTLQQQARYLELNEAAAQEAILAEVDDLQTLAELRLGLVQALQECDRLNRALKEEQENHAKTRKNLTMALGDTVDLLTQERAAAGNAQANDVPSETV